MKSFIHGKKAFDEYEVAPVSETIDINGERICEPLTGQEHSPCDVDFWTVYGHVSGEGVEAIADCPTLEIAEAIAEALREKYLKG